MDAIQPIHFPEYAHILSNDGASVIHFVNKILGDAVEQKASDVHFELYPNGLRIRFRLNGLLTPIARPPLQIAQRVVSRLKVMAQLDIGERRLPQDGHFKFQSATQIMDCRISTCPTLHGEKCVIRLLNAQLSQIPLNELFLNPTQYKTLVDALERAQGMILITGPTGSGKSTTLYAALAHLNTPERNICSLEDPIELELAGINQVQINPKIGLDFSILLRTLLRQDPDVIMLGEMRDSHTADIAIKASQTGHLVLSTLHTNNTAETFARLLNLNIAKYQLASSLRLIIAQRLVRHLCSHCKQIDTHLSAQDRVSLGLAHAEIYLAQGCEQCRGGYVGRLALFEILSISPELIKLLMNNKTLAEITEQIACEKMTTLWQAGLEALKAGQTSIAELKRVLISPDQSWQ